MESVLIVGGVPTTCTDKVHTRDLTMHCAVRGRIPKRRIYGNQNLTFALGASKGATRVLSEFQRKYMILLSYN